MPKREKDGIHWKFKQLIEVPNPRVQAIIWRKYDPQGYIFLDEVGLSRAFRTHVFYS